ncbi:MAG: IS5 family transposase [Verrucomicrobiae bacterium]|nr:IS5 family transposase [Verrucomicrobiae bacterium]
MKKRYQKPRDPGLFDRAERLEDLRALGDPLARLDEVVDWTLFAPVLAQAETDKDHDLGGRPLLPPLLLFKALVIQSLYGLSDAQMQFQITDRKSFQRFLGLSDADSAPDEKTLWAFRDQLRKLQLQDQLFEAFGQHLQGRGLIARQGQMIDATFIEVPRQRNSRPENEKLKAGEVPAAWEKEPAKLRQKDTDARWTQKRKQNFYGYKNHLNVDTRSKLITRYEVTPASVHDSQALEALVRPGDPQTFADSAYQTPACQEVMDKCGIQARFILPARRNRPLGRQQKRINRARSRIRCRIEHVFGMMAMGIKSTFNRCIGLARNRASIALLNLTYNLVRMEQIHRLGLKTWRAA